MVAPTGARRTQADHPALPVTLSEIVATAFDCQQAGADGLHLHLRDAAGRHVLDADLYRQALQALAQAVPGLAIQVTTESMGRYSAEAQRQLVFELEPVLVSISVREMWSGDDVATVVKFYRSCTQRDLAVQHIVYDVDDLQRLDVLADRGAFAVEPVQVLFVLGRYRKDQQSVPADLAPFLQWLKATTLLTDWAVCAFGRQESACLLAAHRAGGKVRVGFENSLWHLDGSIADDNAARVSEVVGMIRSAGPAVRNTQIQAAWMAR